MPTLYVANCSKQRHDFTYRVPEEVAVRRQQIMPGSQTAIYQPNVPMEIIRAIIDQHARYGLVDVNEIDRRKAFTGLCYSLDKPIKVEKFMYVDETNSSALQDASLEARKVSAAALHDILEKVTEGKGKLESLEFEVVEQNKDNEAGINEILSVSRDNSATPTPPRGRGRPRKAA